MIALMTDYSIFDFLKQNQFPNGLCFERSPTEQYGWQIPTGSLFVVISTGDEFCLSPRVHYFSAAILFHLF